ncbi:DUF2917 domain-containing protein [Sphaerotilus mobilis]|nr:DUF2917 domain-containing protein [Sphaerotilus mobilis]
MDTTTALVALPASTPATACPALSLAHAALHRREVAVGASLTVLAGRLWITLHGDPDDHFVAAGQGWTATRAGRCVIQGDADGAAASLWRWTA